MHETRQHLLRAARAELLEKGWEKTTAAGIKARAGISHGSWIWFFREGKTAVGAEVYAELHRELWDECLAALSDRSKLAPDEPPLLRAISILLESVRQQPAAWRLLFQLEEVLGQIGERGVVAESRAALHAPVHSWALRRNLHLAKEMPPALLHAVVLGPVLQIVRAQLAEGIEVDVATWARTLAERSYGALVKSIPERGRRARSSKERDLFMG